MERPNVGLVLGLASVDPKYEGIIVATTHLYWNYKYEWTRVKEVEMMFENIAEMKRQLNFPVILSGDFNADPESVVYDYTLNRDIPTDKRSHFLLPKDHATVDRADLMKVVNDSLEGTWKRPTPDCPADFERLKVADQLLKRRDAEFPKMESAYGEYQSLVPSAFKHEKFDYGGEPGYTSWSLWHGTLDYIFYSQDERLSLTAVLEIPDPSVVTHQTAMPSDDFPSDHLSLVAKFVVSPKL